MPDTALTTLDDLALISARGADALSFLQGQLSQDLSRLGERGSLLAGLHNPQGRCIAVLRLIRVAQDQVLLVLRAELSDTVRQLLARYVLRSKVKIEDAGAAWRVYGVAGPDAAAVASTRLAAPLDAGGLRQLIIAPRGEPLPEGEPAPRESWRLADIAAGLPEIGFATSGLFVAQMLNLDLIDAVSFEKGCYTGQEVIARAHFRGQVKRRMQRFFTESAAPLAPAQRVRLSDGRDAQVVMAAPAGSGQEFLAVAPLTAAAADGSTEAAVLPARQLPLPYALPT